MTLFKKHLGCGTLRQRKDKIWYFEVNNLRAIKEKVIPFFEKFRLLSAKKKRDFIKFKQLENIISEKRHLDIEGIKEILKIRTSMNDGGKRKFTNSEILATLKKSSETTRQAPLAIESDDIVRSS